MALINLGHFVIVSIIQENLRNLHLSTRPYAQSDRGTLIILEMKLRLCYANVGEY